MRLADAIFYQYYWMRGWHPWLYNRLYKDHVWIAVVLGLCLFCGTFWVVLPFVAVWRWVFAAWLAVSTGASAAYFLSKGRWRRIVRRRDFAARRYRVLAIGYPVVCWLAALAAICWMYAHSV